MQKLTAKLKVWDPDTWVGSTEIVTQLHKGNMSQRKPPPLWRPCMLWVTLWDRRPHPLKDSQQFQNGCRQPLRKQDEENNEHRCICFRNTLDYLRCCTETDKSVKFQTLIWQAVQGYFIMRNCTEAPDLKIGLKCWFRATKKCNWKSHIIRDIAFTPDRD